LRDEGGYVLSDDKKAAGLFPDADPSGYWWIPSGQLFYSPIKGDAKELAIGRQHFFLPRRVEDPFGNAALILYDKQDLLVLETEDALGNKSTVGERLNDTSIAADADRASDGSTSNRNDYRVLQAALLSDANGNRSEVAFDALGLVAGTAVMGKT